MRSTVTDSAIILSRTDYAERDRILTLLGEKSGKLRAIAKGVRAAKSKLAGGIELFAENELVLLEGKSELYTVISSRMTRYFGNIAKDIDASMYVYECFKTVNKLAPDGSGEEYYTPLVNLLEALDAAKIPQSQIKIWYGLKLLDNLGASPNFKTDSENRELEGSNDYQYDFDKHCFFAKSGGTYKPDHIKVLRHLSKTPKPVLINGLEEQVADETVYLLSLIIRAHDL